MITAAEKPELRPVIEVIREEPLMHAAILAAVADGPKTVDEIAAAIGSPNHEVMYWVMGMRRYGLLIEGPEEDGDGYYAYGPVRSADEAAMIEECEY